MTRCDHYYRTGLWPENIVKLQLREEWDWTFRCVLPV